MGENCGPQEEWDKIVEIMQKGDSKNLTYIQAVWAMEGYICRDCYFKEMEKEKPGYTEQCRKEGGR